MKTNMIIFFSMLLSLLNACKAPTQKNISAVEIKTDQSYCQIEPCYAVDNNTIIPHSSGNSRLVKVMKKDTAMGIDMGYYLLPNCWSNTENGLMGPDSTSVTDYPIVSKAQLQADFGATELLGYQAIVDECIKNDIAKDLLTTKSRITHITANEGIKVQYQKNFEALFPCSVPPAHFDIKVIEHIDKKGNPGLSVLYFMVFKSELGNALHYLKSELTAMTENYEQDKKDYLYALAHAEYFPEYVQRVHKTQRENPQDVWYQYNNQLLANLTRQYWNIPEYPIDGKYRPWRSNRFGDHEEILNAIDSSYYLSTDEPYDPSAY